MATLTAKVLRKLLHYNPTTGLFKWLVRKPRVQLNRRPGTVTIHGYRRIGINGHVYSEHRLAYLYMKGYWPKLEIDHINGNPVDNKWSNLRAASRSLNNQNIYKPNSNNTNGYRGIRRKGKKFSANIQIGVFDTAIQAHRAYIAVKRKLHAGAIL